MKVFYSNLADSYIKANIEKSLNQKIDQVIECIEKDTAKKYTSKYDKLLIWIRNILDQIPTFAALMEELEQLHVLVTKFSLEASDVNGVAFYWNDTPYIIVEENDDIESIFIHEVCHFVARYFAQINEIQWQDEEEAIVIRLEEELYKEIYIEPEKAARKMEELLYDAKIAYEMHEKHK